MILRADARHIPLRDKTVQCCVTSPPYWGLRDYGDPNQIGLERTPEEYVSSIGAVMREVWRVLCDDGAVFLNLGDSYATGTTAGRRRGSLNLGDGTETARQISRIGTPSGLKTKDLVGIPWRVAFALQQPYEHTAIKHKIDRSWMAALTDGEGCLSILQCKSPHGSGDSFPPILQVRMCDPECIERARQITGFVESAMPQYPASQGGTRAAYQWRLHGAKAAQIAAEIYPYLYIKRKQAIIVWNHQRIRDSYETKRGVRIPSEAMEKQKQCRDLIRDLNRHKPVDIPSWMDEPRIQVDPGFYLRSDVIWAKPNPMPESVTDRPTKAHEYIFLLSKSERYYYDHGAIKELATGWNGSRFEDGRNLALHPNVGKNRNGKNEASGDRRKVGFNERWDEKERLTTGKWSQEHHQSSGHRMVENVARARNSGGDHDSPFGKTRNCRSVWTFPTRPYSGSHFATWPREIPERCIKAGSKPGDIVLDPFCGSGTTVMVAQDLGRVGIGLDLSYQELAAERIGGSLFVKVVNSAF